MTAHLDWLPIPLRPFAETAIEVVAADPRIVGLMAGGSAIDEAMDEFSDLDLVIIARDEHQATILVEAKSFAARLGPLLSAFTGEHVREPRLLLCLYGPPIQRVDLKFIAERDLDQRVEDARILWQRDQALDEALARTNAIWPTNSPQWMEDRFWTWVHFSAAKIGRGELFAFLDEIAFLRRIIIGPLIRMDGGLSPRGVRHIEEIAPELLPQLEATIGDHTRLGCLKALRATVDLYRQLRRDHPEVASCAGAESAVLSYLDEIESRVRSS
ncbi:MAG: hypothetical protein ACRDHN_09505 [Thermomicrobiales bacterium]